LDRTGPADPAAHAYWTGADTSSATRNQDDRHTGTVPGPEINDISQLLDAVTLGNAVAYVPISVADQYVPISVADQHRSANLVFVPVSDLSSSQVVAAWPETSRSRAVADFVRVAVEAAAHASGLISSAR
jgi:DNA-binding transcriptional LysR family regulator